MTIVDDFQASAESIFATFGAAIINATYVEKTVSGYQPGGNPVVATAEYPVELLKDDKVTRATLSLTNDLPKVVDKYLMITNKLPVAPKKKDILRFPDGTEHAIIQLDSDPADIVTTFYVGA